MKAYPLLRCLCFVHGMLMADKLVRCGAGMATYLDGGGGKNGGNLGAAGMLVRPSARATSAERHRRCTRVGTCDQGNHVRS